MNGQDAVLLSVNDCGVKVLTFVPGYPITEVAEALGAEITINEKVALEIALGASATGARSMVLVKQVGMNMSGRSARDLGYAHNRIGRSCNSRR